MAKTPTLFQKIKDSASSLSRQAKDALAWFQNKVADVVRGRAQPDAGGLFRKSANPEIGKMYLFMYDPKWKRILPHWDIFPLVIPIEPYPNGFLGINLHYLPPMARAGLLDSLMVIANNDRYDDTTKLNISYKVLKDAAGRFAGYENCLKRYLFGHVRSTFHYISPADWARVVMLPLQQFKVNPDPKYASPPPY